MEKIKANPKWKYVGCYVDDRFSGTNTAHRQGFQKLIAAEREKELATIIQDEKLKDTETRRFIENAFRDGEIKTTGTDIDAIMPPTSRFGGGNRAAKKQGIIEKLKHFFERFFGIG